MGSIVTMNNHWSIKGPFWCDTLFLSFLSLFSLFFFFSCNIFQCVFYSGQSKITPSINCEYNVNQKEMVISHHVLFFFLHKVYLQATETSFLDDPQLEHGSGKKQTRIF